MCLTKVSLKLLMGSLQLIWLVLVVLGQCIKEFLMMEQLLQRRYLTFYRGASKSFIAECETLRNIRHRNLVNVLTACSGIDYQGNDFKALVYEFMVNKSLDGWLHPNIGERMVDDMPLSLNLLQRLNIAIDVGSTLDYLHHRCQKPIVHCDLK